VHATVITEGRECQARALPGSAVGSATGPVVLADCVSTLHASAGWMPGRILVLTEHAATLEILDELLDAPNALGFVGIVVLADERSTSLAQEGDPPSRSIAAIPVVLVSRAQDRECVRHAVRLSLQVQDTAIEAPIPAPRHHLRRRGAPPGRSRDGSHRVPGTIDLRRK
jgi:hypothetical protein